MLKVIKHIWFEIHLLQQLGHRSLAVIRRQWAAVAEDVGAIRGDLSSATVRLGDATVIPLIIWLAVAKLSTTRNGPTLLESAALIACVPTEDYSTRMPTHISGCIHQVAIVLHAYSDRWQVGEGRREKAISVNITTGLCLIDSVCNKLVSALNY